MFEDTVEFSGCTGSFPLGKTHEDKQKRRIFTMEWHKIKCLGSKLDHCVDQTGPECFHTEEV
jgi:hypothetical protein